MKEPDSFCFTLYGQLPGGKNAVNTTRTGHRYPNKRFESWRDDAIGQLPSPLPRFLMFPVKLIVDYVPGDARRRDLDAMLGALGHLLERAKVIHDDCQIVACTWTPFPMDRQHPRCTVTVEPYKENYDGPATDGTDGRVGGG